MAKRQLLGPSSHTKAMIPTERLLSSATGLCAKSSSTAHAAATTKPSGATSTGTAEPDAAAYNNHSRLSPSSLFKHSRQCRHHNSQLSRLIQQPQAQPQHSSSCSNYQQNAQTQYQGTTTEMAWPHLHLLPDDLPF